MKNFKKFFHGALCFVKKDGYVIPRRFTLEQTEIFLNNQFFYDRTLCGASITLEFITEAKSFSFDYKFFLRTGVKSTFEVYVDGFLTHIIHDDQILDEGKLEVDLKDGKKRIEVYIPNYSQVGIKNLNIDGEYKFVPKRKTKVLFIGDSITQGGGARRSGQTFVDIVKRMLDYEIINQGIGGYFCDKNILKDIPFNPQKIVIGFGTNHRVLEDEENVKVIGEFFNKLCEKYSDKKILVIIPPYYGREQTEFVRQKYKKIKEIILDSVSKYKNVKTVSAYEMIPHLPEYYLQDFIHPNGLGMEVYGQNLVKAIKKLKF